MKRIITPLYYTLISVFLFVSSVIIPYGQAEGAGVVYTNKLLSEYKEASGLMYLDANGVAVKEILNSGHKFQKEEYKKLSGRYGLQACVVVLVLTLFAPFARSRDVAWIGAYFSALFAFGSMNGEFFFGIVSLALIAYFIKQRIEKKRKSTAEIG